MTLGHLFLFQAVVSFGLLGVLHKVADHRGCRPEGVNFMLFFGAAVLVLAGSVWQNGWAKTLDVPLIGKVVAAGCGFLSSLAILSFQHGVRFGKISTSWLIINLSTALPTVLSILIYREAVSLRHELGLALTVVALFILWLERVREEKMLGRAATSEQTTSVS
jgi:drug/metabolite transporter (DMT)-like permease